MNAILGIVPARRLRRRRDALQPAQDLLHAARRRRAGRRARSACEADLAPYLPAVAVRERRQDGRRSSTGWTTTGRRSIGRVQALLRQLRRARARLHLHPHARARRACARSAENAVLNANYLQAKLQRRYPCRTTGACMHEFVASGKLAGAPDVRALDIAKRLIDYGFHPPTIYFPLIVPEALMIEPTETESRRDARRVRRGDAARSPRRRRPIPSCCTTRRTTRPSGGWTR